MKRHQLYIIIIIAITSLYVISKKHNMSEVMSVNNMLINIITVHDELDLIKIHSVLNRDLFEEVIIVESNFDNHGRPKLRTMRDEVQFLNVKYDMIEGNFFNDTDIFSHESHFQRKVWEKYYKKEKGLIFISSHPDEFIERSSLINLKNSFIDSGVFMSRGKFFRSYYKNIDLESYKTYSSENYSYRYPFPIIWHDHKYNNRIMHKMHPGYQLRSMVNSYHISPWPNFNNEISKLMSCTECNHKFNSIVKSVKKYQKYLTSDDSHRLTLIDFHKVFPDNSDYKNLPDDVKSHSNLFSGFLGDKRDYMIKYGDRLNEFIDFNSIGSFNVVKNKCSDDVIVDLFGLKFFKQPGSDHIIQFLREKEEINHRVMINLWKDRNIDIFYDVGCNYGVYSLLANSHNLLVRSFDIVEDNLLNTKCICPECLTYYGSIGETQVYRDRVINRINLGMLISKDTQYNAKIFMKVDIEHSEQKIYDELISLKKFIYDGLISIILEVTPLWWIDNPAITEFKSGSWMEFMKFISVFSQCEIKDIRSNVSLHGKSVMDLISILGDQSDMVILC